MNINITYDREFTELMQELKQELPAELFNMDGIGDQLDLNVFSKRFFNSVVTADASIDANANVDDTSVIVYSTELKKPYEKLNSYYMLWQELKKEHGIDRANAIVRMNIIGDIYIHDFHGVGAGMPYCFNYSTYDIMNKGLPMVKKVKSMPPKYLYSFKSQLEQFVVIASNSTLGATGLADMLVVMSYYVSKILKNKKDASFSFATEEDCWNYVKENLISFIYTINQPMRANQSPFTNVSIYDSVFIDNLAEDYIFEDGSTVNKPVLQKLQELFLDIMNEEQRRTPLTFPVTTACFAVNDQKEIIDQDFVKMIAEKNMEYGFINMYIGKSSTLSSCCRLRSETTSEYFNSFGSGSSKIGSLGVCSINLPRLAWKYSHRDDIDMFINHLKVMVEVAGMVNNAKRNIVKERIENGNHPLYSLGFMELQRQYSTVGVNGLNEAVEILGHDIKTKAGQNLALLIIETINEQNDANAHMYNAPHNCEQVPAENMSVKMANKDKIMGYNTGKYDLYSNQFIPLITGANLLDRIKIQGLLDSKFSGGAIAHLNVETKITNPQDIIDLINLCANKGVVYFAINYNLQQCTEGHMTVGKGDKCSLCGNPIENNFTRVVGFLTNVSNWHKVRRKVDYPNRQFYKGVE